MAYQAVKGTRDFYPEQTEVRKKVFDTLRKQAQLYGFGEVESPAMESIELLTAKSGEEIKEQIFVMEKRSTEQLGLRFDITVPLARMFIARQKELPKPVKWFYLTRMWRYEAPQRGRLREFYQFGVELFGASDVSADAEIISLAIDSLAALGLTEKDVVIKLNSRELIEGFLENIGVTAIEEALRLIDKRAKLKTEEFSQAAAFLTLEQRQALEAFFAADLTTAVSLAGARGESLQALFSELEQRGKGAWITFAPDIARGLAYYTGTVFECFDRGEKNRAILGGGRYDAMVEQFGGQPCPATGFAMGDVVLELFLKEKGLWDYKEQGIDFYVASVHETYAPKVIEIVQSLRRQYKVDYDLMGRKLGKQLAYANTIKVQQVVIVGDETKEGKVVLKDLTSGTEKIVAIDSLCEKKKS